MIRAEWTKKKATKHRSLGREGWKEGAWMENRKKRLEKKGCWEKIGGQGRSSVARKMGGIKKARKEKKSQKKKSERISRKKRKREMRKRIANGKN